MSYDEGVMTEIDEKDLPGLDTEDGRDEWVEILMAQDEETIAANGGWCKALTVVDEQGNMVARFVYPDGREEVFDLLVRRSIDVALVEDRN
jgi:hypothetical protein